MYTILLDSSNVDLSVGIAKDGVLLKEISYEAWQQQSEYMITEVNKLLEEFSVAPNDISSIVCGVGPGSYTGVRISITIAKVMALATKAKVYPVSSLMILEDGSNLSLCLANARSKRSYVGLYEGAKCVKEDTIWSNDEVLEFIKNNPDCVVCGNTKYLGIEGKMNSVLENMVRLLPSLEAIDNHLALKPIYLSEK